MGGGNSVLGSRSGDGAGSVGGGSKGDELLDSELGHLHLYLRYSTVTGSVTATFEFADNECRILPILHYGSSAEHLGTKLHFQA